ncbi:hypothetical protein T4D_12080 [Trichinella pseudospiralis]|uniref:Uncharacterized protein n=1 Tax=Trichinella pseudospiralis TaxID=6337 RepID=A0A0V1F9W1_TRIPS|nr:hypothetical protein T4D_12080 [Trichinella pseudospiralis]
MKIQHLSNPEEVKNGNAYSLNSMAHTVKNLDNFRFIQQMTNIFFKHLLSYCIVVAGSDSRGR